MTSWCSVLLEPRRLENCCFIFFETLAFYFFFTYLFITACFVLVLVLFCFFQNRNKDFPNKTFLLFVGVLQTQRRVTFHLPDGSQESCSDSGLGDPEPSSTASTTQPLPLSFPQEEYYEQTSPNSRTEGDGNSDPESSEYWVFPRFSTAGEFINLCFSVVGVFFCNLAVFVADSPEYRKGLAICVLRQRSH